MSSPGPLGWIPPSQRTQEQQDAHAQAMAGLRNFALPYVEPPKGTKVILTKFWSDPACVADMGVEFTGFGQYTGSCFPGGTPVRLANGNETAIESVRVGDEVITHTGKARRVLNTMTRIFSGQIVTITVAGFAFPLEMTSDHPVAVGVEDGIRWVNAEDLREGDRVLIGWARGGESPKTIDVVDLIGSDRLIVLDELMKENAYTKGNEPSVPNSNFNSARHMVKRSGIDWNGKVRLHHSRVENAIFRQIAICPSLGRLIGLYLAEGGCHEGRVTFTFNADEKDTLAAEVLALVRGLFGVEGEHEWQSDRPNVAKVRFQNQNLAEVFKALVPGNVYSKRIPGIFFNADEETRLALLLGWIDGYVGVKGGKNPGNVRITGVSVCAGLARDMTTLALSCGLKATAGRRKAHKQSRQSYGVDLAGKRAVGLFPTVAARARGPRYTDADANRTKFGYARPIRIIERRKADALRVFDFEVEEDHSFLAGGLTVHNCVGVSEGNAVVTAGCVQRAIGENPTKASIIWWPFPYGRTRYNEGDRGQGEGAVDSVMGKTLVDEGFFDINQPGLPQFTQKGPDGFWLSKTIEYQWSDGAHISQGWRDLAKPQAGLTKTVLNSVEDIFASVINGYPVLDGCSNYCAHGTIKGSGDEACVIGHYDGAGGHSTCFLGYWNHPSFGPMGLYSNQWATSTYPKDPAGGGRCCVWMTAAEIAKLFRTGGDRGETMSLSNVPGQPAQPKLLDYVY